MSIPTSLIVVILAVAWLAVLVPMVARRRERVPETEPDTGTFRVLRRASFSMRRRPGMGRRNDLEEDDIAENPDDGRLDHEVLDEQLLDDEYAYDEYADDEYAEQDPESADGDTYAEDEPTGRRQRRGLRRWGRTEPAAEVEFDDAAANAAVGSTRWESADHDHASRPATGSTRWAPTEKSETYQDPVSPVHRYDPMDDLDEAALRPVPRRPGRGGFDPDAAEVARAYRYSRRRRITVILLLATVLFAAAAYFEPVMWAGVAVFGLLLVSYLGYLRRQVRIETEIRERRLARLRRARQIRPEYHLEHPDRPASDHAFGPPVTGAVPVSQVQPTGYRRGREIVDLEDDDPSFDDLEYYQPISYRRASGQ